jgi:hypothetical protein
MMGLAGKPFSKCEHVYTTLRRCVAAQTRLIRSVSRLQKLTRLSVGLRIAVVFRGVLTKASFTLAVAIR